MGDYDYVAEAKENQEFLAILHELKTASDPQFLLAAAKSTIAEYQAALLQNPNLTDEAIALIEPKDVAVDLLLASHPRCPESTLERLSMSPNREICLLALEHPNNSDAGRHWAQETLEESEEFEEIYSWTPSVPEAFFDPSPTAQAAYLELDQEGRTYRRELLYEYVTAQHPETPKWLMNRVVAKLKSILENRKAIEEPKVRWDQMRRGTIVRPPHRFSDLPALTSLMRAIIKNPATTAGPLRELAKLDPTGLQALIAQNPNAPLPNLKQAMNSGRKRVLVAVAGHPSERVRELARNLMASGHPEVLAALARNPYIADRHVSRLLGSENQLVLNALAGNSALDPEDIAELLQRVTRPGRAAIASNPSSSPSTLKHLSRSKDVIVLAAIAGNTATPPELLRDILKRRSEPIVGRQAAANPTVPDDLLANYATDLDGIRWLSTNPSLPEHLQRRVIQEGDSYAMKTLARNPAATESTLSELANTGHRSVQYRVAMNARTPADTLRQLANSRHEHVAIAARITLLTH